LASAGAGAVFTMAASMFGIAALSVLILGPETQGKILEEITKVLHNSFTRSGS